MRQQWAMFGLGRTIRLHVRDSQQQQQQQQQKNVCATIAVSDLNKEQWTHIEVKRNKNNETIRIGVQYAHAGCFILIHRQRKPFSVSLYKLNFKFQIFCNSQLDSHTAAATGQLCCNYVWLKNWLKNFSLLKNTDQINILPSKWHLSLQMLKYWTTGQNFWLANYGIQPFVLWLARQQHFIGSIYEFTLQNTGSLRWTLDKSDTNWWPNNCIWKMFL